jgi:hypothetical protein
MNYEVKEEKFSVSIALPRDIYSRASFTKGLDETKVLPGLSAKGGFNFKYTKEDKIIYAIEVGAQISAFPGKIPIMASSDNKTIFYKAKKGVMFAVKSRGNKIPEHYENL